jgi:hypothetical protein
MSDISLETVVQRRGDLLANDLSENETVMLDVAGGSYYGLKSAGKAIWDLIEEPRRVDDVCDRLLEDFEVEADVCRRETLSFMERLDERGLLVVHKP